MSEVEHKMQQDWQSFMDAVVDDFNWIIEGENIVQSPVYGVLNICRVLQLLNENNGKVHSKDEGGEWALSKNRQQRQKLFKTLRKIL